MRSMDTNGSNSLDLVELEDGLHNFGVQLTEKELDRVFKYFDRDSSGTISISEFLRGLRGKMPRQR